MGKAKQNKAQVHAFTNMAIPFLSIEPPLSRAIRFNNPAKMIAMPEPTNQRVSVFMCKGKAKLICTIPKRIMIEDIILMRLCTAGFIHLNRGAGNSAITAKYATIALLWFDGGFTAFTFIKILTGVRWHCFLFLKAAVRTSDGGV